MYELNIRGNSFSNLQISPNSSVFHLDCGVNEFTSLDFSGYENSIPILSIDSNGIENFNAPEIDTTQQYPFHFQLDISHNPLQELGMSKVEYLHSLRAIKTKLTEIDMSQIDFAFNLILNDNPKLTCVKVSSDFYIPDPEPPISAGLVRDKHTVIGVNCDMDIFNEDDIIYNHKDHHLFPNPASDQFTISWSDVSLIESVRLLNFRGNMLFRSSAPPIEEFTFSSGNLPLGSYYIEVKKEEQLYRKKFIKFN